MPSPVSHLQRAPLPMAEYCVAHVGGRSRIGVHMDGDQQMWVDLHGDNADGLSGVGSSTPTDADHQDDSVDGLSGVGSSTPRYYVPVTQIHLESLLCGGAAQPLRSLLLHAATIAMHPITRETVGRLASASVSHNELKTQSHEGMIYKKRRWFDMGNWRLSTL